MVKDKHIDNMNLIWEEELVRKEVIWPLRFRIHVLKVINRKRWNEDRIRINDFNLNWQIGFRPLQEQHLVILTERAKNTFNIRPEES